MSSEYRAPVQGFPSRTELKKGKTAPSAVAMIDMALYDILGKRAKLPLYLLLGGYKNRIKTSITIGILPVEKTLERAKAHIQKGFKSIKLKGGRCVEKDIEKLERIRALSPLKLDLRFDANQGYSEEEVFYFLDKTKGLNIEIIEQPLKPGEDELLRKVTKKRDADDH